MNDITGGHTVHAFSDELPHLSELVKKQGALGREQLQRAVQTLKDEDPKAAGHVIDRDREMNDLDVVADEEIIDEKICEMIDDIVAGTPHAVLDISDMGGDTTEITVSARSVRDVENMIDDGLLEYAAMLDGEVSLVIEFDDRGGATILITQTE